MNKIKIGDRFVGDGEPCFIIAEVGCNHDGKINQAKEMIDMAVDAKCDAVKFQSFTANKLFNEYYPDYKEGWISLLKSLELPKDWHKILSDYCKEKGIIFLSSCCDEEKAEWLEELDVPAFKIPSYELTHIPLLKYTAKKNKPIIMSTGIAVESEIQEAINTIKEEDNNQIIIMHCVSSYPGNIEDLNLKTIPHYKKLFNIPIGLSDHCPWIESSLAAVMLGANIIEKHITLNKNLPGPDHKFALDKEGIKTWVKQIRSAEKAIGKIKTSPADGEKNEVLWRRCLWAKNDIPQDKIITEDDIMIVRPSPEGSLPPKEIYNIIGKKSNKDIKKGGMINFSMLK